MNPLNELFETPKEKMLPPIVRWWQERLALGDKLMVDLYNADNDIGLSKSVLVVERESNGTRQKPETFEWDDELNSALVHIGVRAISLEKEGDRFALGLRAALRKVERKYGDGYLNAILVELINESDLAHNGEIGKVIKQIHTDPPDHSFRSYAPCRDLIANEIGGRAVELRDQLRYGKDELKAIMNQAIARYLDERFLISSRRAYGF